MVKRQKGLARLWEDKASVFVKEKVWDEQTKQTGFTERLRYADLPCKLSYGGLNTVSGDDVRVIRQEIKLFLAPDVQIPPGSIVYIARPGKEVQIYRMSGEAGIYRKHQEIPLARVDEWA